MFQLLSSLFALKLSLNLLLITSPIVNSRLYQSKSSLRDALDVLARKQRSLDLSSQEPQHYYNPLRSNRYTDDSMMSDDDDSDDLDFIPMNNPNQVDDIKDNSYQRIEDIKFAIDSLRDLRNHFRTDSSARENSGSSLFRERERIGNHKRDTEHMNGELYNRDNLSQLFLDTLHNSPSYNDDNIDNIDEYPGVQVLPAKDLSIEMFEPTIYNKYRNDAKDRIKYDDVRRTLAELTPSAARQIVMERYPISREYKNSIKRFPVAKRSGNTKKLNDIKLQENTDPKVAQDLKSLFGSHTTVTEENLMSSVNNRERKMEHNHQHTNVFEKLKRLDTTTDNPTTDTTILNTDGQNEIELPIMALSNVPKNKMRVKKNKIKKSVDWSEYVGIDRRRKKTEFLARPDTQDEDMKWFLQLYYKLMTGNLGKNSISQRDNESNVKCSSGGSVKRDKIEQMDQRLKNVMNLIMKGAVEFPMSDNNAEENSQEVKDDIMARLAAAYIIEKMRSVLNNYRNSLELEHSPETLQNSEYQNINTINKIMNRKKRDTNNMIDIPDNESSNECLTSIKIKDSCNVTSANYSELFIPCTTYKLCKFCGEDNCISQFFQNIIISCKYYESEKTNVSDKLKPCLNMAVEIISEEIQTEKSKLKRCDSKYLLDRCLLPEIPRQSLFYTTPQYQRAH